MGMRDGLTDDEAKRAVARVLAGDQDGYAEIVTRCQDPLRRTLAAYSRSPEELEDFCHAAFVEAYFKLSAYDPQRGAFLPWLLAVARNSVLAELRRRKAEGLRLYRYLERAALDASPREETELAHQALEHCLSAAGLEPDEVRMIQARYREGRDSEQIAVTLGKTAIAVRKWLQRLRERLRLCVEHRLSALGSPQP